MNRQQKTIEELKEELDSVRREIIRGKAAKRRIIKEIKKKKRIKPAEYPPPEKGLDEIIDQPPNEIVNNEGASGINDVVQKKVDPYDPGTRVDELKGISDIIDA